MLYKIKRGSAKKSYGIFVADMLKFPKEIIENAK